MSVSNPPSPSSSGPQRVSFRRCCLVALTHYFETQSTLSPAPKRISSSTQEDHPTHASTCLSRPHVRISVSLPRPVESATSSLSLSDPCSTTHLNTLSHVHPPTHPSTRSSIHLMPVLCTRNSQAGLTAPRHASLSVAPRMACFIGLPLCPSCPAVACRPRFDRNRRRSGRPEVLPGPPEVLPPVLLSP